LLDDRVVQVQARYHQVKACSQLAWVLASRYPAPLVLGPAAMPEVAVGSAGQSSGSGAGCCERKRTLGFGI
jgi:hypothetical protein